MNLVRYWEWLNNPESLFITDYPAPVVRGLLNFQGQSLYARVSYGNRVFRVLCNAKGGILSVSVAEIGDFSEVPPTELTSRLRELLESAAKRRNSILCAAE